jgi:hypothetical protein
MQPSNVPADAQDGVHAINAASDRLPLIDVLDRVLDKGIVITYDIGIAVVGLRVIEIHGNTIVASIETYLHRWEPRATDGEQVDAFTSAADEYLRGLGPH